MKTKKNGSIVFIAFLSFFALTVLHGQKADEQQTESDQKERMETLLSMLADEKNRIDSSEFDFQITVTDSVGNPLDNVKMEVVLSRPKPPFLDGKTESQRLTKTIKSKLHFNEKGWTNVSFSFMKDGYRLENRHFHIKTLDSDKSQLTLRQDIQIKMIDESALAELAHGEGVLNYNLENGSKIIFDLSIFPENDKQKDTLETHKTNVNRRKEDVGEYDDEEEEGEEEEEKIKSPKTMKLDTGTKSKPTKYIELDFKRDQNGDVEKEIVNGISRPTACVVRLCSNDSKDGLFFADECIMRKRRDCLRNIMLAPADGYKKEYEIKLNSPENNCIFLYLKCGDHYGKAMLETVFIEDRKGKLNLARMAVELFLNKKSNDRNVLSN